MHCPPFETQNVSTLVRPHFRIHPSPSPPPPKPVTHVTRQHQTSSTTPENYGFPKTDATVTSVTMPYQYPLPSRGRRGCRCLLGPKTPLQLLCLLCEPLPPLPSQTPQEPPVSQPGPQPFRALPVRPSSPRGRTNNRGCVEIGLDSPPTSAIIARPYAGAHAR